MYVPSNEPEGLRLSAESKEFQILFETVRSRFLCALPPRYGMDEEKAAEIIDGAFRALMQVYVLKGSAEAWVSSLIIANAEAFLRRRKREIVERGMEELSPKARAALLLHFDGLSDKEIAAELDVSEHFARCLVRSSFVKLLRLQKSVKE